MSREINQYVICSCLDGDWRIMGLTLDELIPMLLFCLIGFLAKILMIMLVLAGAWYYGLRLLKKGQGSAALLLLFYRHASPEMAKSLFRAFPSYTKRYWW